MIVTVCYFLKSIKSVCILIQFSTSLNKNYFAHSITVVSVDRLNLRKKRFVCTLWLSLHMKSVAERGFFYESAFNSKAIKTFIKF